MEEKGEPAPPPVPDGDMPEPEPTVPRASHFPHFLLTPLQLDSLEKPPAPSFERVLEFAQNRARVSTCSLSCYWFHSGLIPVSSVYANPRRKESEHRAGRFSGQLRGRFETDVSCSHH